MRKIPWLALCVSLVLVASTAPLPGNQEPEVHTLASSEAVLFPKVSEVAWEHELDREIQQHQANVKAYYEAVKAEQQRQEAERLRAEQEAAQRAQRERERQRAAEAVTTTSQPPPARHEATGSCGGWEGLVSSYFGNETGTACRVLMCESHGNPTAYNPSGASGLFQFLRSTWQRMLGMSGEARDHPAEVQIAQAKRLRDMAGWGQWSCY